MKFSLILADPPWAFKTYSEKGQDRSPSRHYDCLTPDEIMALRVDSIAEANSVCLLWCTSPHLQNGIATLESWGFVYKTILLVWIKTTPDWTGLATGTGYYSRANAEYVLCGTRGKGLTRLHKNVHQVIIVPRQAHSVKPVEAYERIERLFGDVSRLELFARCQREGWTATGLELDGKDIRTAIKEFQRR